MLLVGMYIHHLYRCFNKKPSITKTCVLTVEGFFDTLKCHP